MTTSHRYRDNVEDDSSFDVPHSLPTPEELHTEHPTSHHHGRTSKKFLGLLTLATFAVTSLIGLSVAIAARKSSNNVDAPSSSSHRDKTPGFGDESFGRHPDQDVTQRFQDITKFLNKFSFIDSKVIANSESPQHAAVRWMANEDPAQLEVPVLTDYDVAMEFMQRYILATFFYSTNGHMWKNRLGFLSNLDVCYWNELAGSDSGNDVDDWHRGVKCNDDGEVNYLFLRTCESIRY